VSLNKALAHATEVRFGEVCAKWTTDWRWCVFDGRGVRQGARMVESDLSFAVAVERAYALSIRPAKPEGGT
jgi:hypothetical protein